MKSLVIDRVGHSEFRDIEAPVPGDGEVLIDIQHVGLCGSDLNTYSGLNPLVELPRIPGHEIGGTIRAHGSNVAAEFAVGKSVVVIPYTTCGKCSSCRQGRVNACQFNRTLGVQQDGALRNQIVAKTDRIILNSDLPSTQLALVEPLSVGFHAVARGRVQSEETVLVLGGGMIGVGAALGAKARGARVIVSEVAESKADVLLALGVDVVINPAKSDLEAEMAAITDNRGPDVVIEAVGLAQTFREAIALASFSGRVVYVGYAKNEVSYDTKFFNLKELDIMGSRNATRDDFEAVIDYLSKTPKAADLVISKVFPWNDADQAFDYWVENRDQTFKVMIDFTGST
ncbi:MAG: zinc-binding alcohol dehydrogenase family protein [Roseibium sp.]